MPCFTVSPALADQHYVKITGSEGKESASD